VVGPGCAVAGRLASDSSSTVLLIEAAGTTADSRRGPLIGLVCGTSIAGCTAAHAILAPLGFALQLFNSLDQVYEPEPEPGSARR
jgi:choline dehydrogenase-like flavoprotein